MQIKVADWLFWTSLAGMLWIGQMWGVGLLLRQFALAAGLVAGIAAVGVISLEDQLHIFLLLSFLSLLSRRLSVAFKLTSRRTR